MRRQPLPQLLYDRQLLVSYLPLLVAVFLDVNSEVGQHSFSECNCECLPVGPTDSPSLGENCLYISYDCEIHPTEHDLMDDARKIR